MINNLNIFDFDGTLFRSPEDSKVNREIYEKHSGIPWNINKQQSNEFSKKLGKHIGIRRGWWGRAETLENPLVPNPIPQEMWIKETVEKFFQSKNCKNTYTVIMTGRHVGIQSAVLKILHEGNLITAETRNEKYYNADANVSCLFRGMSGPGVTHRPMPNDDTISWKIWIIEKYLKLIPELENVNIWEDREEHVLAFNQLNDIFPHKFNIFHVI